MTPFDLTGQGEGYCRSVSPCRLEKRIRRRETRWSLKLWREKGGRDEHCGGGV